MSMPDGHPQEEPFRLIPAAQAGFPQLYRYQRFDRDRLTQIVQGRRLYFSNPRAFNDPWDCRPWFDVDGLEDPAHLERHITWYERITKKHLPGIPEPEVARRAGILRSKPALVREKTGEVASAMEQAIQDRYRVYCLGSAPDSELMWAHYAASHTGVCLEFATRNALFCGALRVQYRLTYPTFDLTADADDENLAPLLIKSAAWAYEGEYRLIAQEQAAAIGSETLLTKSHLIEMPETALSAIIVGCLADDATVDAVKALVTESGSPIAVRKAVRERNRYRLTFLDVV